MNRTVNVESGRVTMSNGVEDFCFIVRSNGVLEAVGTTIKHLGAEELVRILEQEGLDRVWQELVVNSDEK